jgi:hypothetical protein
MIRFESDRDVDQIDLKSDQVKGLVYLLHYLAGRAGGRYFSDEAPMHQHLDWVSAVAPRAFSVTSLNYEQINELLVLVDESRISRAFFEFFFRPRTPESPISLEEFKEGVKRFRGFAMLCYGNFRYPFRRLREMADVEEIKAALLPWTKETEDLVADLGEGRPVSISCDENSMLGEEQTRFLGYIVRADIEEDLKSRPKDRTAAERAQQLQARIKSLEKKGRRNSAAYMSSDYLDVYFATSMRNDWEFRETYKFIREVLENPDLIGMQLRYFDPTQAYMDGVLEKGILEALMLKRARCTVYLVQEADTLGKDSELAATLAQGKLVVAYVRALEGEDLRRHRDALRGYPVAYYQKRIYTLLAEDFFARPKNRLRVCEKAEQLGVTLREDEIQSRAIEISGIAGQTRRKETYRVLGGPEEEKESIRMFLERVQDAPDFIAALDAVAFDRRAETIAKQHPLAMQVNLQTGVANGVLVVRDGPTCAKLLKAMLTNELKFYIDPKEDNVKGEVVRWGTLLREAISGSTFRYVTDDPLLSNAFWNFYLRKKESFSGRRRVQKEATNGEEAKLHEGGPSQASAGGAAEAR